MIISGNKISEIYEETTKDGILRGLEITCEGKYISKTLENAIKDILNQLNYNVSIEYWADFDGKFFTTAFFTGPKNNVQ